MRNRHKSIKYLASIVLVGLTLFLSAQSNKPAYKFDEGDTTIIGSYIQKGTDHASVNNDSALYYADLSEKASQQIKNERLLAKSLFLKAKIYYFKSDYSAAQYYQYKSLALCEKTNDKILL